MQNPCRASIGATSVMGEVLRSGAIILMGISVMAAGVVVAFYG